MKHIGSVWVDIYFSTFIRVIDFSPGIIQKVPIQGRPPQGRLSKVSRLEPIFFLPSELSIFLMVLFQTNRTGHESSNWTGQGLEGSTPSFPLEKSSVVVPLWLQDIRITATNRQVLKWHGSDCKVCSGPYRKESRLCSKQLDFQDLEAAVGS